MKNTALDTVQDTLPETVLDTYYIDTYFPTETPGFPREVKYNTGTINVSIHWIGVHAVLRILSPIPFVLGSSRWW